MYIFFSTNFLKNFKFSLKNQKFIDFEFYRNFFFTQNTPPLRFFKFKNHTVNPREEARGTSRGNMFLPHGAYPFLDPLLRGIITQG